jgi:hypothetical protein
MTTNTTQPVFSNTAIAGLALLFIALPIINWLSFGPLIPERTFLLISTLDDINTHSDPSNIVYYFARPFLYSVIGWIFSQPLAFLVSGFICHSLLNSMVFTLAYLGIRKTNKEHTNIAIIAAATFTASVYPLALLVGVTGHGTTLIPHDAYHDFSFRTIFLILSATSFIFLLRRKYGVALLVAALGCYVHPTAGVLYVGLTILAISPILLDRKQAKIWFVVFLAIIIAASPTLYKLLLFELPPTLFESMSYGDWYSQLIKDEADDFSTLYQLIYYPLHTSRLLFGIIGLLFIYSYFFDDYKKHRNFWFAAAFPVLFFISAIAEYFFAVVSPGPLTYPIIVLTPGYRILSLAFFPLAVLATRVIHHILNQLQESTAFARATRFFNNCLPQILLQNVVIVLIILSGLGLIGIGASSGNLKSALSYGSWAAKAEKVSGIDDYLRAAKKSGVDQYSEPSFYMMDEEPLTYDKERSLWNIRKYDQRQPAKIDNDIVNSRFRVDAFIQLVEQVRSNIAEGEGLIVPPYLRYFRDALPKHAVFFQEHHDGNLMMGSPKFMRFWNKRMIDLLGFTYEGMPSRYSGFSFSLMREKYLQIDTTSVASLHRKYPKYRYMITEIGHRLEFKAIIETGAYVVYDLSIENQTFTEPVGPMN